MKYLPLIICAILFFSCDSEEPKAFLESDLVISHGTACGWCGGFDSLRISEEAMYYEFNGCDAIRYERNEPTDLQEWVQLLELLDINEFQKIDINTCNICVDGCDIWIDLAGDTFSHRIRFGYLGDFRYSDSLTIEEIRPFVEKLDSIRLRFRPE